MKYRVYDLIKKEYLPAAAPFALYPDGRLFWVICRQGDGELKMEGPILKSVMEVRHVPEVDGEAETNVGELKPGEISTRAMNPQTAMTSEAVIIQLHTQRRILLDACEKAAEDVTNGKGAAQVLRKAVKEVTAPSFLTLEPDNDDEITKLVNYQILRLQMNWTPVDQKMPHPGRPVLVRLDNPDHTHITWARACWIPRFYQVSNGDDYSGDDLDYSEKDDIHFWPEGWYEWNQYEETHWKLGNDVTVTHWREVHLGMEKQQ